MIQTAKNAQNVLRARRPSARSQANFDGCNRSLSTAQLIPTTPRRMVTRSDPDKRCASGSGALRKHRCASLELTVFAAVTNLIAVGVIADKMRDRILQNTDRSSHNLPSRRRGCCFSPEPSNRKDGSRGSEIRRGYRARAKISRSRKR